MKRLFLAAILGMLGVGCANPCADLADRACQAGGEQSEECLAVREKAEKATEEDKRACTIALELVENLERAR